MSKDVCEVNIVHGEVVKRVGKMLPELGGMVTIFKALAEKDFRTFQYENNAILSFIN